MKDEYLETELLSLKHRLHQLMLANEGLKSETRKQALIISELICENKKLKKKLIDLQDKLNINSTN